LNLLQAAGEGEALARQVKSHFFLTFYEGIIFDGPVKSPKTCHSRWVWVHMRTAGTLIIFIIIHIRVPILPLQQAVYPCFADIY